MSKRIHVLFNASRLSVRLSELGIRSLLMTYPLARLSGVSFLGALGPGDDSIDTRLEHSLGTAYLSAFAADACNLTPRYRKYLAVHGLLHDLGHWPLAHTCEAVFERLTDISGHRLRAAMIKGADNLPKEYRLNARLRNLGIDPELMVALLEKREPPTRPHNPSEWEHVLEIVSSPINPDTLDGIFRAAHLANIKCPDPLEIVAGFGRHDDRLYVRREIVPVIDSFWTAKARVYREFINTLESKLWETRYAKAALSLGNVDRLWALSRREDDVREELERRLQSAAPNEVLRLAFRKPREYFIENSKTWSEAEVPVSSLKRRYMSEALR